MKLTLSPVEVLIAFFVMVMMMNQFNNYFTELIKQFDVVFVIVGSTTAARNFSNLGLPVMH